LPDCGDTSIISSGGEMKPLKKVVRIKEERPAKEKVSREEALKRVKSFPKRKEGLIASIREGSR